jgi:hypothetical protein
MTVLDQTRVPVPVEAHTAEFPPHVLVNNPLKLDTSLQEQCNWCWAAVASHVNNFLPSSPQLNSQCEVAGLVLEPTNCCASPSSCNSVVALSVAMTDVGHPVNAQQPDDQKVQDEINAGRPAMGRIDWTGGGASHFLAFYGYVPATPTEKLQFNVADPRWGPCLADAKQVHDMYRNLGKWASALVLQ